MATIIRGTTPTLKYVFKTVNVANITTAYLTIKGKTQIEKTLSDATVGTDFISWKLSQAETLSFGDNISVMINWKTDDGTRGASKKTIALVDKNFKEVEI